MPKLLHQLHWASAVELNDEDRTPRRQVWYSHWDRRLYTEGDIYSRINYIHRNPVKHGYVDEPGKWPWSSWAAFYETEDPEVQARLDRFPAPLKLPGD